MAEEEVDFDDLDENEVTGGGRNDGKKGLFVTR